MEPTKFGRYEIKAEIGRGGMATVYYAYDPRFEREVAIKVLPHEMLHDTQFRTRFEREAKTIAMLEHPAIVPVYDFGEEDGQPYFVMRYMPGGSLSDRMKLGPMSIEEVARLMTHLAPALDEAHAKGIIHRDLKPGNILFDQYNDSYISDFGIAKLTEAQGNFTGSAIVGTPAYMSPEQAQGESIDGRSDIYGLGVIMFEMLTGQQPYHGDTPMSVVVKHITDPVPHIQDIKPDLSADVETIVEKTMAKDRNERFQTVKSLAEALSAVARGETPKFPTEDSTLVVPGTTGRGKGSAQTLSKTVLTKKERTEQASAAPRKRGGLWIGLGAAALVLVLAGIGGFLALTGQIPFLAAPVPTQTKTLIQDTPTQKASPVPDTPVVVPPPAASDTPAPSVTPAPSDTPAPSPTPTVPGLASIGGADLAAFLSDNNIWIMGVDGADLKQLTKDNTEKHDLQWAPDGQSLFYISGKCVHYVTVPDGKDTSLACFTAASYLDAFEISPDGQQVAVSLDRILYLVPFNLKAFSGARNWTQLRDMKGCFTYGDKPNQPIIKNVRWSGDNTKIAADTLSVSSGTRVDLILIFDISKCDSNVTGWLDNFPGSRFSMTGFAKNPVIPFFSWDGQSLFLLNSIYRFGSGYLYAYNYDTKREADVVSPLKACCYQSAIWSPDGSYIMFAYQDIDGGKMQLYYVPYGTIGTGATYQPLELPDTLFVKPNIKIEMALRSAR